MGIDYLTFREVFDKSHQFLSQKGVPSPKCDIEWIVSHVTGKSRMNIYLNLDEIVDKKTLSEIRGMLVKRAKREPLQHLLKSIQFCDLQLKCDHRALVPRPETERLIEIITERIGIDFSGKIYDFGSGSGAILLALCNNFPHATGVGLDSSKEALDLSTENAEVTSLFNRVKFEFFDWMNNDFLGKDLELIVSNPPYLTEKEWSLCEPEVKVFDPKEALVSPMNGFAHIMRIIRISSESLKEGGSLFLEIGLGQSEKVCETLSKSFKDIDVLKDLNGIRRFIHAKKF
jgi:release factor glutamine methyltransferase